MTTIEGSPQSEPQLLTEHRVREIVAEIIDQWQEEVCRGLPGPSEQMLALMAEGEVR